jgi:phosphoribosylanthranilate isomerase/indole-3-glycerol phosphate synthase/phosphoribosylanthranilate isomerase
MPAPQIKICGITDVKTAQYCADLGAAAIGLVFFTRSPRSVTIGQAAEISRAVSGRVQTVGLFVNPTYDTVIRHVNACGLTAVQLHGGEPPELVARLVAQKMTVIKALFQTREPLFEAINTYAAHGYLLECGRGRLPGGNAKTWDWRAAAALAADNPVVLAGGLNPENVGSAIEQAMPDAVDVSSGVESAPGVKDHARIRLFVESAAASDVQRPLRRVF